MARFFPGETFVRKSVAALHITVVGCEDDGGVAGEAKTIERLSDTADVGVELGDHRVVLTQIFVEVVAVALIEWIVLLGFGRRRAVRPRVGVDVDGVRTTGDRLIVIHPVVFPRGLFGIVRVLVGDEQGEGVVFHAFETFDSDVGRDVGAMVVVDVFDAFFVVEFHAVEKVVVTLVSDELGEVGAQFGRDRNVAGGAEMPFADPARTVAAVVEGSGEGAGALGDIGVIAKRVGLRTVLTRYERRTKWRADGRVGVGVLEEDAISRETVEIGVSISELPIQPIAKACI